MIHLIFWFYYCRLLPHIYGDKEWTETGYIGPCLLMLFSYLNIMLNIWMILIKDTTSGSHFLPSIRRPSWIFCSTCVINSPPRSYHCEFCDRCILKRDHHCVFLGTCIGYSNFRYFFMLVLHTWLICFYLTLLNVPYTLQLLGGFSFSYVFSVMIPLLAWLFGVLPSAYLLASFITGICSLIFVGMFSCFVYHCQNVYRGRTTYERRLTSHEYDLGWKRNFLDALGYKYYLVWIFPLLNSPLPGNGIDFHKKSTFEATKTM